MITTYPNDILARVSEDVPFEEGLEIGKQLLEEERGLRNCVGLAAPQIGINKNVFTALGIIYINPKITYYSPEYRDSVEGCFSLPNAGQVKVRRAKSVRMSWLNKKGEPKNGMFNGFHAIVLQHEYDHLQGKLCNGQ